MKQGTSASVGGFEKPSAGWHTFVVKEGIKWAEKDGAAINTLLVPMDVVGTEEEGSGGMDRCNLDVPAGRRTLAVIIGFSTLAAKIEKKMDLNGAKDMNELDWGNAFLEPGKGNSDKVIDKIINNLPGCELDGKIKHVPGVNKTTGEKDVYANFKEYAPKGEGGRGDSAPADAGPTQANEAKKDDGDLF